MNVIGHQHVGLHDAAIAISIMLDPIKVGHAVASVAKNITSVIARTMRWYEAPRTRLSACGQDLL